MKKPCPVNTSCDHLPHLDHPSTSLEPEDHSIVGSDEPESILESEDLLQLDSISVSSQATCSIETETNLSPTDVFSGHHDYEMFILQKEIDAPHDNLNHHVPHDCEEQDQDTILTHATILSHTFALPQFMDQHNCEDQERTDTPSTIPTDFQVSCDHTLHPECTHNLMAIQCNQYPNPSHNPALPHFLAHHNCEDLESTDTPHAVPTALQAPTDDTYNPKCAHNPMETQCNQSQSPTLMKQNCTHNPSTSQVKKSKHTNPMVLPYPPDPREHVMERSATPTALVERDKLDLSSLVPPKGEMESSFSWTYPFKSPTSSTLCFGEPTLRKLNQVKLICNHISSTLCDFTLEKFNQETEFYITKHMPKSSSGTNRVFDCHSNLMTTSSSRWILDKSMIEVTKALIHHIGKNGEHFYGENFIYENPKSWNNIKPNYTSYGCMLMEIDWGGKFNYTSCGCPMTNWQGHETHRTGHNTSEVDGVIDHAKEAEEEPTPYHSIITLALKLLCPEGTRWYWELDFKDHEGNPIGVANRNPILDTRVYEVEFTDGGQVELGTHIIAECMYAQCDVEGKQFHLMEAIVDHKMTDDAVQKERYLLHVVRKTTHEMYH